VILKPTRLNQFRTNQIWVIPATTHVSSEMRLLLTHLKSERALILRIVLYGVKMNISP
jgi:hypothetical protein